MKTIIILAHYSNDNSPYIIYVHEHAKALVKKGYKVKVLVNMTFFPFFKKKSKKSCVQQIDGVEIIYKNTLSFSNLLYNFNINGLSYFLSFKKTIKKIIKNNEVVLIDAHTFKVEGYVAYKLKKKYGIKTFVTLHGTSFNNSFKTEKGKKQIQKIAKVIDKYICVSNKLSNQLKSLNIENQKVIYNGIEHYDVKRINSKYNICTIASFVTIKNIDVVINSFTKIVQKYKTAKLFVIGDGPLKYELMQIAKTNHIETNVIFTGIISNAEVYNILSNCNIFCLLSKPEGFGISYVEAMYCGCITIGTKNEGIDGFIKNRQNGFLNNVNSEELTDTINFILENDCDIIRKQSILDAKKLSWDFNAQQYCELINIGGKNK